MRLIRLLLLIFLNCPAVSLAQNEPFVAIRATEVARQAQQVYPNCPDGRCPLIPPVGWGRAARQANQTPATLQFNGVVIDVVPVGPGNGVTVLTCAHAFQTGGNPQVQIAGSWRDAQVVATEFARDLALLWVPATTAPKLAIAQTDPDVGAEVFLHVYDHQRGGGFVRVPGQLGKPLRATNGIARWESSGGAVKGMSGGAYTHNGQLIGIQILADRALDREETVFAIAIMSQRDSIIKFLTSYGVSHQIQSGDGQARLFVPNESNNEPLPAVGGIPVPPLERQANPDAPASPHGGASGSLQPAEPGLAEPEPVKSDPAEPDAAGMPPGTEAPLSFPKQAKGYLWDGLCAWGWAAVGAGIAGPLGWAIPIVGRRLHRRLKDRRTKPEVSAPVTSPDLSRIEQLLRELKQDPQPAKPQEEVACCQTPFPRYLDEADQLRRLRQREGRVAALDALVGMLFDDEMKRALEASDSPEEKQTLRSLRDRIMDRVDEIAPIATPAA